jgi:hypothetical protein
MDPSQKPTHRDSSLPLKKINRKREKTQHLKDKIRNKVTQELGLNKNMSEQDRSLWLADYIAKEQLCFDKNTIEVKTNGSSDMKGLILKVESFLYNEGKRLVRLVGVDKAIGKCVSVNEIVKGNFCGAGGKGGGGGGDKLNEYIRLYGRVDEGVEEGGGFRKRSVMEIFLFVG